MSEQTGTPSEQDRRTPAQGAGGLSQSAAPARPDLSAGVPIPPELADARATIDNIDAALSP
ncbi:MAG: hypothetical protein L0K65_07410, partial [Actinomyces sp.]|nr:hypothetical protein [Actinomyces sp.]